MRPKKSEPGSVIIGRRRAISNWFRDFKTLIDPDTYSYKIQETFFGIFRVGKYKVLPRIDYVLVFRQFFTKCEACTFDENEDTNRLYYQVSLVHHKNRRIVVHETHDKSEAFSFGTILAGKFRSKLRDSASVRGANSWLHPGADICHVSR